MRPTLKSHWFVTSCAIFGLALIARAQEAVPPAFEKPDAFAEESATHADAYDPFDLDAEAPKMIQVQAEFIELSHEALTKLLFLRSPKGSDATELRKQLQEMVSKQEATMHETLIAIARSGQKTTSESIHEFIYPTEYEPAAVEGEAEEAPEKPIDPGVPSNPPTPTAFETRNLGSTLEAEPTLGEDGRTIDLRLVPELVWHTGDTSWGESKDSQGTTNRILMPDIYTLRVNTTITCITGQYTFVAALSPKNSAGHADPTRKVMVFVKCDVLSVK